MITSLTSKSAIEAQFPFPSVETVDNSSDETRAVLPQFLRSFHHFCQKRQTKGLEGYEKTTIYVLDLRKKGVFWLTLSERGDLNFFEMVQIKIHIQWDTGKKMEGWAQKWEFTIIQNGYLQRNESYLLAPKDKVQSLFLPFSTFNGNEVEVTYPESLFDLPKLGAGFWDEWKKKDARAIWQYRQIIYPLFEYAIDRIGVLTEGNSLTVLDLAGGDGELAFKIAERCFIKEVVVIDSNRHALEKLEKKRGSSDKVTPIFADITSCSFREILQDKQPNVILLSGVVTLGVLSYEEAYSVMIECYGFIKEGGYILIGGHSAAYFRRSDYEEMGFEVLNASGFSAIDVKDAAGTPIEEVTPHPFYVLTRK